MININVSRTQGGGRVERWCWINFQAGRPANLDYSSARASALAVGAEGGCLDIFSLIYHFSSFPLSGRQPDLD